MRSILKILLLSIFCLSTQAIATTCDIQSANKNNELLNNISGYVEQKFFNAEYECGIQAVEYIAKLSQTMEVEKGTDARFDLRNLALKVNDDTTIPVTQRFALLKAAASSTLNLAAQNLPILEFRYDALLFLRAGDQYKQQLDTRNWLEALILSISLDQHLPDAERVTTGYISFGLPVKAYKYLDSLVRLAKLIKHDKKMLPLRSDIASVVYFDIGVWDKDDSKQDLLNQAKETLELLDAIDDVMECRGCEPQWRWQIYVHVGTAYYQLGMIEEAKKNINQAIKIVDSITNQDNRLYTLGIVVVNLYSASPDKETISTIIKEIKVLADSQQTPTAKIAQDHIPQYIQHFGLEE